MSKISLKHSGGNVVSLNSPTNAPGSPDVAFKLPNADGSAGQFMKTDGSGNLSFDAAGGGKILKVVGSVKTDVASQQVGIATPVNFDSDFSQAITPTAAGSKILVTFNLSVSLSVFGNQMFFRLRRKVASGSFADITDAMGDADSGRYRCFQSVVNPDNVYMMMSIVLNYLDTPTYTLGDSLTYSFSGAHDSGSTRTIYLNREGGSYAGAYVPRGASSVVLKEVAP